MSMWHGKGDVWGRREERKFTNQDKMGRVVLKLLIKWLDEDDISQSESNMNGHYKLIKLYQ